MKTGLYLNLLKHEITSCEVEVREYEELIHNDVVKNLIFLGLEENLPSKEVLVDNIENYCSLFSKKDLTHFLSATKIIIDVNNSMMASYNVEGEILSVKEYYTLEYQNFKELFDNLGKDYILV